MQIHTFRFTYMYIRTTHIYIYIYSTYISIKPAPIGFVGFQGKIPLSFVKMPMSMKRCLRNWDSSCRDAFLKEFSMGQN